MPAEAPVTKAIRDSALIPRSSRADQMRQRNPAEQNALTGFPFHGLLKFRVLAIFHGRTREPTIR
jgi:hypothetical protein